MSPVSLAFGARRRAVYARQGRPAGEVGQSQTLVNSYSEETPAAGAAGGQECVR